MKRFRLNGFGHLFIKAGSLPFLLVFSVFSFLCCFVACGVWELTLDLFGKTQTTQTRAHARSDQSLSPSASCCRSRFVVAKGERHGVTQAWSTTEWRATGEGT